jgi:thiamine-monophosphate kinase
MKLSELGEFGLIDWLRQAVGEDPAGILGIGDDCACWSIPHGYQLLVTTDLLLEGVHFRRDWTDMRRLGRKAVAVNLSDIAAMGGSPERLVLGLGLPTTIELAAVEQFLEGFLEAAREHGVHLVGGDTCRAQQFLTISVTAFGTTPSQRAIRRDTARPGDLLFVSGTLGDSALGLQRLQLGGKVDPYLLQRHLDPTPRIELGARLAASGLASAMLDISDGLLADLGHLLGHQVPGALIKRQSIPLSEPFKVALEENPQLWELALSGGEDYELLFTSAADDCAQILTLAQAVGVQVTPIGEMCHERQGLWLEHPPGEVKSMPASGFQHFSSNFEEDQNGLD